MFSCCCLGTAKIAPTASKEAPRRNAVRNSKEMQSDLFALAIGNTQPFAKPLSPRTVTKVDGSGNPHPFVAQTQKTSSPSSDSTH